MMQLSGESSARSIRSAGSGDENVGADRLQRCEGTVLRVGETLRDPDDPDHETDTHGETDGGEDRTTESAPQLPPDIGKMEHAVYSSGSS